MRNEKVRKLVIMAVLIAVSVVLIYVIHVPLIPAVPFLEYDPADIPILVGAMAYGPVAGLIITVIASVIQGITVSAASGPWGILMHIIATGVLVVVSSTIYKFRRTRGGAVVGLLCGTLAMGLVMIPANHFITPIWMGAPADVVDALILPGILPFNLLKAGINSVITFLVYKVVSKYIIHGQPMKHKKTAEQA